MQDYWQRFLIFIGVITIVLGIGYAFIAFRMTTGVREPSYRLAIWLVFAFFLLLSPAAFLFRMYSVPERVEQIVSWVSYLSFGFFAMLFALIASRDIALWMFDLVSSAVQRFRPWIDSDHVLHPGRREFLISATNFAVLALTGGMFGYGVIRARSLKIEKIRVPIKDLPDALSGFTIAQVTDIHIGPTLRRGFAEEIVNKVNNLNPDLIAVTGDVVDGSVNQLRSHTEPFADFRAKHGVFFVTGNHEYYSGALAWISEFRKLGFQVLLNEHVVIRHAPNASLMIAGVTDYRGEEFFDDHRSDPALARQRRRVISKGGRETAEPVHAKVLLAHQPRSIHDAAMAGFDLQISGHTHGGQFFPGPFLVRLQQPYVKGLHLHENKTWIYVSRGTGYWGPPLRVGADPEITLIELVKA